MADDNELDVLRSEIDQRFEGILGELQKVTRGSAPAKAGRSLEDEFTREELDSLRETREFEKFRRNAERLGAELEREADRLIAENEPDQDDDDDDEEVDDDDDEDVEKGGKQVKPVAKKKPAAKKQRPRGGRHPQPDQLEPEAEKDAQSGDGLLSWLVRD